MAQFADVQSKTIGDFKVTFLITCSMKKAALSSLSAASSLKQVMKRSSWTWALARRRLNFLALALS